MLLVILWATLNPIIISTLSDHVCCCLPLKGSGGEDTPEQFTMYYSQGEALLVFFNMHYFKLQTETNADFKQEENESQTANCEI